MDMRLAFTGFLFAFCAVVLADRVYGFSERFLAARGRTRPGAAASRPDWTDGPACDWYVHFYRSDLTGETVRPVRSAPAAPSPTFRAPSAASRRDTRPRVRA
ncbi:hypothetical protein DFW101_0006 [Solidesulfovibrio carbinoliphilus subsp. oakridgensis]|uniref:Uncharacterized protein n=1 Tax=Solidesulfovibrio carbinoliphilus subsp. oakridgensis TaxID=694327 RepID=G7QBY8_9BACT|nr:hypothetical protein [Solidesulfovibrio carbinoliphilus]EHJ46023.1 hypothetical protein DFW101_0006 [Solidesulfovibrio carbinoliphilus subsp. oakridgensis]